MKKLFFLAAVAGAALVSCTENDPAPQAEREITFATPVVGSESRTENYGELTNPYPTTEDITVYGVWHSAEFAGWDDASLYMDKANASYDDVFNGWRPDTRYYWPKNGYLTFAAYSPSDVNATNVGYDKTGLKLTGFQVAETSDKHVDVLYSQRSYNKKKSSDNTNTPYDQVDLDFVHALSSIQFTAKKAADYGSTAENTTNIILKKISIIDVYSKGDFDEKVSETTPGTYNATPTWSNPSANDVEYVYYDNNTGYTLTSGAYVMNGVANQTDVIALPQTLPDGAKFVIEYQIDSPGSTTPAIDQTYEIEINDLTGKWEPGYRYTYHISIGLDEIYFAPEVLEWTKATDTDVNVSGDGSYQ